MTRDTSSQTAKRVISLIQSDFPLCERPYAALGEQLGIDETEVFATVQEFIDQKAIRRIGAIFDSYKLGYRSTLCALAVTDPEDVDTAARLINAFPQVTHNYERRDHYNIWFTLIAPSQERIDTILAQIVRETGYTDILDLPALRLFKIRVDFDLTGQRDASQAPPVITPARIQTVAFSTTDKALVRILQGDISGSLTPFAHIAEEFSEDTVDTTAITEADVIARTRELRDLGAIRRFGAVVSHHKLGFSHNAMCVWNVEDSSVLEAGALMAANKEVSHCYERPRKATWPANMYTMVHGTSVEACQDVADRIHGQLSAAGIEVEAARLLFSTRELKKVSMRYFAE